MGKPIVAIVGRPNVGKSTLFNRLVGQRISIVQDTPGVTRDRIYADVEWSGREFTMIDTGGIDPVSNDIIAKEILKQAEIAIETADVILFLVDVKSGVMDIDHDVANLLRKADKPVVLAVNKVDDMRRENLDVYEFYSLGIGDPIAVSAEQSLAIGDLLDEIIFKLPEDTGEEIEDDVIRVAVVGKPNVGKSSIINRILGEERVIVSDIPGTTRDAIDTPYEKDGQKYIFIDTAGIRRKARIKEDIERYSIIRAIAAIEKCDVCILVVDATVGITAQDAKIAGIAHERGKASIIAINKWDLIEKDGKTMNKFINDIDTDLKYMFYAPKVFISALTGQRMDELFELINLVADNAARRISTGVLNDVLVQALAVSPPPADKGKQLRIYFATQVSVKPPTFILFVNDGSLLHFTYERYIENQFRQAFGFTGTPIHFMKRNRESKY